MDQRRELRFPVEQTIAVTVLENGGLRLDGTVKNASGRGLALEVSEQIPPGTPIRLDVKDCMLLGEVMFCRPVEHAYLIGIELDQMLADLAELSRACSDYTVGPSQFVPRNR